MHLQSELSIQSPLILVSSEVHPRRDDPKTEQSRCWIRPNDVSPSPYLSLSVSAVCNTQTHVQPSGKKSIRLQTGKRGLFAPATTGILQVKLERIASVRRDSMRLQSHPTFAVRDHTVSPRSSRKKLNGNFEKNTHEARTLYFLKESTNLRAVENAYCIQCSIASGIRDGKKLIKIGFERYKFSLLLFVVKLYFSFW